MRAPATTGYQSAHEIWST